MRQNFLKALHICGTLAAVALLASQLNAQQLTLEGQTGGFITPTAYVVPSANNHSFSMPAVGFHFVDASSVIGNVETISVTEGWGNRLEFGYTSSLHQAGNNALFSPLWSKQDYFAYLLSAPTPAINGMNVFHGKVVVVKENTKHFYTPGVAVGGVYRQGDHFVSGSLSDIPILTNPTPKATYGNGDIYAAMTKTWANPPIPVLINFGVKGTNAVVFGLGGVAESWSARLFGGIGIPLPLGKSVVAIPSAGFTSEPSNIKNLDQFLAYDGLVLSIPNNRPHIPTTLDYAVRFTQRKNAHFSVDIGIGQLAGNIGTIAYNPGSGYIPVPINLDARHVFGMGVSFRP